MFYIRLSHLQNSVNRSVCPASLAFMPCCCYNRFERCVYRYGIRQRPRRREAPPVGKISRALSASHMGADPGLRAVHGTGRAAFKAVPELSSARAQVIGRSFVKIKKISETRKKYPRKAGLPAKEPLS